MDIYFSKQLKHLNAILTLFIVGTHARCDFMIEEGEVFSLKIAQWYGNLFWIAVPGFFWMSGLLFYYGVTVENLKRKYASKMKRRIYSIVIPYFLYSIFWMLVYVILKQLPVVGGYIGDTALDYGIWDNLKNVLFASYNSVEWYLRVLILIQIVSPAMFYVIKTMPFFGGGYCCCDIFSKLLCPFSGESI